MLAYWENRRKWGVGVLSALSPGLGQWANGQQFKALIFLCIHSLTLIFLWTPLIITRLYSTNRLLIALGALALWTLSVLDAYIYSSDRSIPFFSALTTVHKIQGLALVVFLSALSALNIAIPDPVLRNGKIPLLIPTVSIAASAVFDPVAGGIIGLSAIILQLFFRHHIDVTIIPQCLSILTACGLAALIGKRRLQAAGISTVVPDVIDVFILKRKIGYSIYSGAFFERLIIHWLIISGLMYVFSLGKRWLFSHFSGPEPVRNTGYNLTSNISPVLSYNAGVRPSVRAAANSTSSIIPPKTTFSPQNRPNASSDWGKLLDIDNLNCAWERVQANNGAPGVDGVTVETFSMNAAENLYQLQSMMERGQFQPSPLKKFNVPKTSGSFRELSIPTVRDRIVQQALMQVLIPVFEPQFLECSFAYRPGRSAHHALKRVDQHLREGNKWILDGDIQSFFDTVDQKVLLQLIEQKVKDSMILDLIGRFLYIATNSSGTGIPQGAATSTLYANIYLHVFDQAMTDAGYLLTRYSDDFVVINQTPESARSACDMASQILKEPLHLQIKAEKTRICNLGEGFVFLGYHFDESGRRPSERAVESLTAKVQEKINESRQLGENGADAMERLRAGLRGWCNYFGIEIDQLLSNGGKMPSTQMQVPIASSSSQTPEGQIDTFLSLFKGRCGVYARQWTNQSGKHGYVPVQQDLSRDAVQAHFTGQHTIAVYLMREDNTVSFMAIDVDSKTGSIEDTHDIALGIKDLGARYGLSIYIEDSGSKGRHCWIFFSEPVPASEARQLGKLLVTKVGPIDKGIACEVFPKNDRVSSEGLGSLIKLPLGLHQVTRRRCLFLEDDGSPVHDQMAFLQRIRRISPEILNTVIARLSGKAPITPGNLGSIKNSEPTQPVQQILNGCNVLKYLVNKAEEMKHLNHSERLVLLYTIGHSGEDGAQFIHHIMSYCNNYNPSITQKWLNRMEPGHDPISCSRIKDWLYDIIPVIGCDCTRDKFQGKYPSPVFSIPSIMQNNMDSFSDYSTYEDNIPAEEDEPFDKSEAEETEQPQSLDDLWDGIQDDMFSLEEMDE